ncbi:hypothetical protein ElyMa_003294000 [Elysia marginata]|uniref:Uncharacterized protein n=1 Tax=Elysia marginata TaxID=1093978 RepID=A0AAV4JF40_9GAST|nr:hypothetical protein ElyMa_003294000 [Elysia marginata]
MVRKSRSQTCIFDRGKKSFENLGILPRSKSTTSLYPTKGYISFDNKRGTVGLTFNSDSKERHTKIVPCINGVKKIVPKASTHHSLKHQQCWNADDKADHKQSESLISSLEYTNDFDSQELENGRPKTKGVRNEGNPHDNIHSIRTESKSTLDCEEDEMTVGETETAPQFPQKYSTDNLYTRKIFPDVLGYTKYKSSFNTRLQAQNTSTCVPIVNENNGGVLTYGSSFLGLNDLQRQNGRPSGINKSVAVLRDSYSIHQETNRIAQPWEKLSKRDSVSEPKPQSNSLNSRATFGFLTYNNISPFTRHHYAKTYTSVNDYSDIFNKYRVRSRLEIRKESYTRVGGMRGSNSSNLNSSHLTTDTENISSKFVNSRSLLSQPDIGNKSYTSKAIVSKPRFGSLYLEKSVLRDSRIDTGMVKTISACGQRSFCPCSHPITEIGSASLGYNAGGDCYKTDSRTVRSTYSSSLLGRALPILSNTGHSNSTIPAPSTPSIETQERSERFSQLDRSTNRHDSSWVDEPFARRSLKREVIFSSAQPASNSTTTSSSSETTVTNRLEPGGFGDVYKRSLSADNYFLRRAFSEGANCVEQNCDRLQGATSEQHFDSRGTTSVFPESKVDDKSSEYGINADKVKGRFKRAADLPANKRTESATTTLDSEKNELSDIPRNPTWILPAGGCWISQWHDESCRGPRYKIISRENLQLPTDEYYCHPSFKWPKRDEAAQSKPQVAGTLSHRYFSGKHQRKDPSVGELNRKQVSRNCAQCSSYEFDEQTEKNIDKKLADNTTGNKSSPVPGGIRYDVRSSNNCVDEKREESVKLDRPCGMKWRQTQNKSREPVKDISPQVNKQKHRENLKKEGPSRKDEEEPQRIEKSTCRRRRVAGEKEVQIKKGEQPQKHTSPSACEKIRYNDGFGDDHGDNAREKEAKPDSSCRVKQKRTRNESVCGRKIERQSPPPEDKKKDEGDLKRDEVPRKVQKETRRIEKGENQRKDIPAEKREAQNEKEERPQRHEKKTVQRPREEQFKIEKEEKSPKRENKQPVQKQQEVETPTKKQDKPQKRDAKKTQKSEKSEIQREVKEGKKTDDKNEKPIAKLETPTGKRQQIDAGQSESPKLEKELGKPQPEKEPGKPKPKKERENPKPEKEVKKPASAEDAPRKEESTHISINQNKKSQSSITQDNAKQGRQESQVRQSPHPSPGYKDQSVAARAKQKEARASQSTIYDSAIRFFKATGMDYFVKVLLTKMDTLKRGNRKLKFAAPQRKGLYAAPQPYPLWIYPNDPLGLYKYILKIRGKPKEKTSAHVRTSIFNEKSSETSGLYKDSASGRRSTLWRDNAESAKSHICSCIHTSPYVPHDVSPSSTYETRTSSLLRPCENRRFFTPTSSCESSYWSPKRKSPCDSKRFATPTSQNTRRSYSSPRKQSLSQKAPRTSQGLMSERSPRSSNSIPVRYDYKRFQTSYTKQSSPPKQTRNVDEGVQATTGANPPHRCPHCQNLISGKVALKYRPYSVTTVSYSPHVEVTDGVNTGSPTDNYPQLERSPHKNILYYNKRNGCKRSNLKRRRLKTPVKAKVDSHFSRASRASKGRSSKSDKTASHFTSLVSAVYVNKKDKHLGKRKRKRKQKTKLKRSVDERSDTLGKSFPKSEVESRASSSRKTSLKSYLSGEAGGKSSGGSSAANKEIRRNSLDPLDEKPGKGSIKNPNEVIEMIPRTSVRKVSAQSPRILSSTKLHRVSRHNFSCKSLCSMHGHRGKLSTILKPLYEHTSIRGFSPHRRHRSISRTKSERFHPLRGVSSQSSPSKESVMEPKGDSRRTSESKSRSHSMSGVSSAKMKRRRRKTKGSVLSHRGSRNADSQSLRDSLSYSDTASHRLSKTSIRSAPNKVVWDISGKSKNAPDSRNLRLNKFFQESKKLSPSVEPEFPKPTYFSTHTADDEFIKTVKKVRRKTSSGSTESKNRSIRGPENKPNQKSPKLCKQSDTMQQALIKVISAYSLKRPGYGDMGGGCYVRGPRGGNLSPTAATQTKAEGGNAYTANTTSDSPQADGKTVPQITLTDAETNSHQSKKSTNPISEAKANQSQEAASQNSETNTQQRRDTTTGSFNSKSYQGTDPTILDSENRISPISEFGTYQDRDVSTQSSKQKSYHNRKVSVIESKAQNHAAKYSTDATLRNTTYRDSKRSIYTLKTQTNQDKGRAPVTSGNKTRRSGQTTAGLNQKSMSPSATTFSSVTSVKQRPFKPNSAFYNARSVLNFTPATFPTVSCPGYFSCRRYRQTMDSGPMDAFRLRSLTIGKYGGLSSGGSSAYGTFSRFTPVSRYHLSKYTHISYTPTYSRLTRPSPVIHGRVYPS